MGSFSTDNTDSYFVGIGAREGWTDMITSWGNNLCVNSATESYKIDLIVDGTTIETGQTLSCDYTFQDGALYYRDDTSQELDKKLYIKSTAKTQFMGLRDDVANALENLGDETLAAEVNILDEVLRGQDTIKTDITDVFYTRETDVVGDVDDFVYDLTTYMEDIRTDF